MRFLPPPAALWFGVVLLSTAMAPHTLRAQTQTRIGIIGHPGTVSLDSLATEVQIDAPQARTFSAVAKLFDELKVSVDVSDPTSGTIGASNVPTRRTFANERMSTYLNCGRTMTGPIADSYRVYVTVVAFMSPVDANHTKLRIAMVGGAQDLAGNSTEPVQCGTTGRFETRIFERVRAMVDSATSR